MTIPEILRHNREMLAYIAELQKWFEKFDEAVRAVEAEQNFPVSVQTEPSQRGEIASAPMTAVFDGPGGSPKSGSVASTTNAAAGNAVLTI